MKTPVNAKTLKNHLTYSWWKYLLVLFAGTFLVDLLFTVTAPQTPEELKVEFYIYGHADTQGLEEYINKIHETEMSDMESVTYTTLTMDATYGPGTRGCGHLSADQAAEEIARMQLTTYIAVNQGDLYYLPREDYLSLASNGAFLPLEEDEELMAMLEEAGVNLRRGWRTVNDTDETHLFGIPADLLPGLARYCYTEDGYLSVLYGCGNNENTLKLLRILVRDNLTAPET